MYAVGWLLALVIFVCLANQNARGQTVSSCGCMDIVFVQDTTGSMGPPINNVKAGLANIVNAAVVASGGDVRFGLVTFSAPGGCGGDGVEVNQPFTTSIPTITAAIGALFASGGCGEPESSDEALKYTVTGATACSLLTPLGDLGPYRSNCVKIAILDTDARPGGCDDTFTPGVDDVNAANDTAAAAAQGIKVSAIYNEDSTFFSPTIIPIMQNYAAATGGEYVQTPADGSGTGTAIADIINSCGGVITLTLSPVEATNIVGQTHTVTSCIASNGIPLENVTISINVTGANTASGACLSDSNGCCSFSYVGTTAGDDAINASATVGTQTVQANAQKTWLVPPCPTCDGSAVVVTGNVTINFNTPTPTYTGDPALVPYFSFDKTGADPSAWKAIFDVGGASLLITSNATITTTQVSPGTNNRKAPGIEIHSTCSLQLDQGSSITVASLNQQAGDIVIEVDGPITINGVVSDSVGGTRGRPGNIIIGTACGDITTGPHSKVITYGDDFGGSDINIGSCDTGNIAIHGLVDASYNGSTPSTIRVASFGGSVTIDGTNPFGTEVVSGTLRTITSGLSVRSRRDPDPGTIEIQADQNLVVVGSTLLSKKYPNYGAVAIKTASNSSKGGLIDARAINGSIIASDRAFDDANRYNAAARINLQAGSDIGLSVSGAINDGASDNRKAVVSSQAGDNGKGGTNLLRSFNGSINIGTHAQVLANFAGTAGANGANLLTACGGVNNAGTVSPADANTSDDSGVCSGTPDPLFLDCGDLGITIGTQGI
jgi:hypothetical protein